MKKKHTVNLICSFCGKSQHEVKALIAGPTVYICDERVGLCNDIITEAADRESDDLRRILLVFSKTRSARSRGSRSSELTVLAHLLEREVGARRSATGAPRD